MATSDPATPSRRTLVTGAAWAVPAIALAAAVPEAAASEAGGPGAPPCTGVVGISIQSACVPAVIGPQQQAARFTISAQNVPVGQTLQIAISGSGAIPGYSSTPSGDITGTGPISFFMVGTGGPMSGTIDVVAQTIPAGSDGFIQARVSCYDSWGSVNIRHANTVFSCTHT